MNVANQKRWTKPSEEKHLRSRKLKTAQRQRLKLGLQV